jgi:hypothetical protein
VTVSIKGTHHNDNRHKHKLPLCWVSLCWMSYFLIAMLNVVMLSVVAPFSGRFLVLSANIRLARKKIVGDKQISLFSLTHSDEEEKGFITLTPRRASSKTRKNLHRSEKSRINPQKSK